MGEKRGPYVIVSVDLCAVQRKGRAQNKVVDRTCAVPLAKPGHELCDCHDVVDVVPIDYNRHAEQRSGPALRAQLSQHLKVLQHSMSMRQPLVIVVVTAVHVGCHRVETDPDEHELGVEQCRGLLGVEETAVCENALIHSQGHAKLPRKVGLTSTCSGITS
ncbi:MAG: hypothetical protein ACRDQU_22370 [Pseudonocardiaceae bacterium]